MLPAAHRSASGNLSLTESPYLAGYGERMGAGTPDVIRRCVEADPPEPEFTVVVGFVTTVPRSPSAIWMAVQIGGKSGCRGRSRGQSRRRGRSRGHSQRRGRSTAGVPGSAAGTPAGRRAILDRGAVRGLGTEGRLRPSERGRSDARGSRRDRAHGAGRTTLPTA